MPDPRAEALAGMVARVETAARRLARVATRAAVAAGVAGLVLWAAVAGGRVGDWWRGTATSLLVLAACLAPAVWLVNVRYVLAELLKVPDRLGGLARWGAGDRRGRSPGEWPDRGLRHMVRAAQEIGRDASDILGSVGAVAQLVAPTFWFLTAAALAAVPVLALLAALAALVAVSR